jgi:hypothetical protein
MTSQTKNYIEVSDIIGIRCECKECHAALALPLATDVGKSLLVCPRCGKGWARQANSTSEILIEEFARKVQQMATALPYLGFTFLLEIKEEERPCQTD